jgi:hypothetical protein
MRDSDEPLDEELPDAIVARLARVDRAQSIVDPRTDREIAARAGSYFAGRPQRARRGLRWALPLSAAAAVLVAFLVVRPFGPGVSPEDDVDGSGRVDILDAFALARLRANGGADVSEERIDALAARVVSLGSLGSLQ